MFTINNFLVPIKTAPRCYLTKIGVSKKLEWLQIEGVPCKIIEIKKTSIIVNSFTSCEGRNFEILNEEAELSFEHVQINLEGFMTNLPKYPCQIHISEFDKRTQVNNLKSEINKIPNVGLTAPIKKVIDDKLFQLIQSQGAPYITMNEYQRYIDGEIKLSPLKQFGNDIFNRNCRWCPPIDITYDEFQKSKSYPAPLGIRPKDFCLPSEIIETLKELITQIANFSGVSDQTFKELKKTLPFIEQTNHTCKYCGKCVDINLCDSKYKSEHNYIEICHRDPNCRYLKQNMYWGHGECNRRQGGYSETDRVQDALILLQVNPELRTLFLTQFKQLEL